MKSIPSSRCSWAQVSSRLTGTVILLSNLHHGQTCHGFWRHATNRTDPILADIRDASDPGGTPLLHETLLDRRLSRWRSRKVELADVFNLCLEFCCCSRIRFKCDRFLAFANSFRNDSVVEPSFAPISKITGASVWSRLVCSGYYVHRG